MHTSPPLIFLIGMPGVGKTYWGRNVAAAFGWHFADLDACISQNEGQSVADIFTTHGEAGFRQREQAVLLQLIDSAPPTTIIACGGGTPCYYHNMQLMKEAGKVVYLQATIPDLVACITADTTIRPLLQGETDIADKLHHLLAARSPVYEQAHYILQAGDISVATFAQIIASCTNRQ